jgi:hypothetical protein
MEERATTGVDTQQATENQALLEANSQQSVVTVTPGKRHSSCYPSCSTNSNTHMHSLTDKAGVTVLSHVGWVLPMKRKGTATRVLLQQSSASLHNRNYTSI